MTSSADTPASTHFDGRLLNPVPVKRDLFDAGATSGRSRIGYGDLLLANPDGALDGLLNYGWDGRAVTVYKGVAGAAFPASFDVVFAGTAQQCVTPDADTVAIKLRDNQADLETSVQPNKYAGSNALPDGLEGVSDISGKPKPLAFGKVTNVPAVCVNTSKLIYQVHDGALASIDAVYDNGVGLAAGGYWTVDDAGFGSEDIQGLCYGAGLYVAVGTNGTITTSPDGDTWTARTSGFSTSTIYAVAYDGTNLFVAVGASGKVSTSPDGITWTARTPITGTPTMRAVTWASGLGLWVAVGAGATLSTSPDGITWTNRTSNYPTGDIHGVAWNGSILVAVGNQANVITSVDGTTWANRSVPFGGLGSALNAVAYGDDRFIAVGAAWGSPTKTLAAYSVDGLVWQLLPQLWVGSSSALPTAVCYGNGQWLVVGTGDRLASSRDGVSWIAQEGTTPYSANLFACCFGSLWVVGGDQNSAAAMFSKGSGYVNVTDLQDDSLAPRAGEFTPYLPGGYFRLGAPPAGQVTVDCSQGAAAANRTQAQLFAAALQRAGKAAGTSAGNYLAADLTALDALDSGERGHWFQDEITFAEVLDEIASPGAWWGIDRLGRYRIAQFRAPEGPATFSITANDMDGPPRRVMLAKDAGKGVPPSRSIVRYQRNYTVQGDGLAGSVSDVRRAFLAKEWREAVAADAAVKAEHLLADDVVYDSGYATAASALAEARRLQVLRGILRHAFDVTVKLSDYATVDLWDVGTLTHSRYGLSAGLLFRVIGIDPDSRRDRVTLRLWGPSDPTSLMRGPVPTLTGTGTVA